MQPTVHVIHENPEWLGPFAAAFEAEGIPFQEWFLDTGVLGLVECNQLTCFHIPVILKILPN